jgi:hypothetical protein
LGLQMLLKNKQISPMLHGHNPTQYSYKLSLLAITCYIRFNQYDIPHANVIILFGNILHVFMMTGIKLKIIKFVIST